MKNTIERAALVQTEYAENIDVNSSAVVTTIDRAKLPLNGSAGCTPTYPNQFVRANNVFEVRYSYLPSALLICNQVNTACSSGE
jgi:hypothetical protein